MQIIQISDSHLSRDKPDRASELASCIQYINSLQSQPDAVIHTGDVAHNGLSEEYAEAKAILDRLKAPYFVLAGNRDHRANLIAAFADGDHLRPGMDFVQYAVEDFATRLIVVDSVSETNKGSMCAARLQHVEAMLAADSSRPAAVFVHHPPFEVSVGPEPRHYQVWREAEQLAAAIGRHRQVCGLFCGHVHRGFETRLGALPAHVVSCVVSDVRWDTPQAAEQGVPVFKRFELKGTSDDPDKTGTAMLAD